MNYNAYNTERKMIHTDNGHRYLVDFVCLEKREGKPNKYLAIGYETATNKKYGWVEINEHDPVKAFVGYIEAIDKIEKDEFIKEYENKHP